MKRRILGLAGAAIWLTIGASFSGIMSLLVVSPPYSRIGLGLVAVATTLLIEHGVIVIGQGRRLPSTPRSFEDVRMARQFFAVFAAEIVAIAAAYVLLLTDHARYLPGLTVGIVGVHFLPLARIFRCPRYYTLGALFCGAGLMSFAVAGTDRALPFILPGLVLPPGTWAIAGANVREAARLLQLETGASEAPHAASALASVRLSA
jgi:hypothetical protein